MQKFTVDLHGVVDLLANHLYSGPRVYIRELLQNAVDATVARGLSDPGPIALRPCTIGGRPGLEVQDHGVGLTKAEAQQFIGVIGNSSKRDEIGMARESLIGQFGVGILSCFAVSDRIEISSRSESGSEPVTWTGLADGTWETDTGPQDQRVGSTVRLIARHGEEGWFDPEVIVEAVRHYGELLRVPVVVERAGASPILATRGEVPIRSVAATVDELIDFGRSVLDLEALDAFPIESITGQTTGVAYVLPFEPSPGSTRSDRVYVKGMLVDDDCANLLPDWAFFVRCIVDADGLRPTASREELHDDDLLAETRRELGESVRDYLMDLARSHSDRLARLVATHHLSLKALAVADPEFCALIADWLPIVSAEGTMSIGEFRARHPVAYYTKTIEEFRQVAPIALAQGIGLVCGGYLHDADLIEAVAVAFEDFSVDLARVEDLFRGFGVLAAEQAARFAGLLEHSRRRLDRLGVDVAIRRFEPYETPALLAVSDEASQLRSLQRAGETSTELFSGILEVIEESVQQVRPLLCLNAENRIVGRLVDSVGGAPGLVDSAIDLLYLQALMAGQHPMRVEESVLLNASMLALLDRSTEASS